MGLLCAELILRGELTAEVARKSRLKGLSVKEMVRLTVQPSAEPLRPLLRQTLDWLLEQSPSFDAERLGYTVCPRIHWLSHNLWPYIWPRTVLAEIDNQLIAGGYLSRPEKTNRWWGRGPTRVSEQGTRTAEALKAAVSSMRADFLEVVNFPESERADDARKRLSRSGPDILFLLRQQRSRLDKAELIDPAVVASYFAIRRGHDAARLADS